MTAVAVIALGPVVDAALARPATATLAGTSTPSPSLPAKAPDPDSVTPGVLGFLVVFVLAIVTWLLMRNMTGRLRRMRYREEQRLAQQGRPDGDGPAPGTSAPR